MNHRTPGLPVHCHFWSPPKPLSIVSLMPFNYLIYCYPPFLVFWIIPSNRENLNIFVKLLNIVNKPIWRILNITLIVCEIRAIVQYFEHSLGLPFFGIGMKTDIYQSRGHCWVFQVCWHIECSSFTSSSLRIWSSSTGIPSPPLALFIVILQKAHLTSYSRMSSSRWVGVITPSWLSRLWRNFFVWSSCAFLISS